MTEFELVRVTRQLARCEDIASVTQALGAAARRLVGADGVTLVLRDGAQCYYADEEAVSPLWKALLHRHALAVPDVHTDPRIPQDVYRPSLVKSLAVAPIRAEDPIGVLCAYWSEPHDPSGQELEALQALAESAGFIGTLLRVEQLTALVEEATDALLLGGRQLVLRQDLLDLRGIARSCADRVRPAYRRSNITLVPDLPARPVWITGDSARLSQAVCSILEHARLRTPERGRVMLRVVAEQQALLSVQAVAARAMSARSLGMAVAKALVNLHDGSFDAGSEAAGASAGTMVRLPLRAAPADLD